MQLDLSADHCAWDQTEPVTIERAGKGAPVRRWSVPLAKGRQVRSRERSPSGGVYLGFERNWHVPQRHVPEGETIRPGDVVLDLEGTRWTALTADWSRLKQRWALGCVNLTLALGLFDVVTIERATISYDDAGAAVKAFPPAGGQLLYALSARVQLLTQEAAEERGLRYDRRRYDVTIDRQVERLDAVEDRLKWLDGDEVRHLDIVSVRNPQRIDELPVLTVELRK